MIQVHTGDALTVLQNMPDCSVNCCVTSPPYFGLRDYGVDGQIGQEKTPAEYVQTLVQVFREVRRILRDDGTLWVNLGDTYAANRAFQVPSTKGGNKHSPAQGSSGGMSVPPGMKAKDLIGIPWMVAFALRDEGWYLRNDIIWNKPNAMPQSVSDRCTSSHEHIFLLSKSPRYYFDSVAIRNPPSEALLKQIQEGYNGSDTKDFQSAGAQSASGTKSRIIEGARKKLDKQRGHSRIHAGFNDRWSALSPQEQLAIGSNKRDVWTVATKPFKGAHFAVFPPDLIRPCVLAGCPVGGVVLDPFGGSGTTAQVCVRENRSSILIDLNPNCPELLNLRLEKDFDKNILTEKHKCVNLSSPAPDGVNINLQNMNLKTFALIAGILATAFTQIKNVCLGQSPDDSPADPAPPKDKKTKGGKTDTGTFNATAEPEDAEEEDLGEEEETKVDYEALKKECRSLMRRIVANEENKPKARAALKKLGEVNLGDAADKNLPAIKEAFKKLAKELGV